MIDPRTRADERRAIFTNFANGVSVEDIMAAARCSREDVMRDVAFVAKKIREYRFRRLLPPLPSESEKDIRWNRLALLETLGKLGPEYLASELILPRIGVQAISSEKEMREAARETRVRATG